MLRSLTLLLLVAAHSHAQDGARAAELAGVDITERLGEQLPLDARFVDQRGRAVSLRELLNGDRPAVLVFAYHRCPVLCDLVHSAVASAIREIDWTVGEEYDVLSISIDPRDTPESARRTLETVLEQYGRARADRGFHFLTTSHETDIRAVTEAAGFGYVYDARADQYGHAAAMMIVTPDGRMSRYLYGLGFEADDVRLGLLEAAKGNSLSTLERVLVYCYRYDPQGGRYTVVAENIMKVFGAAVVLVLGTLLFVLWRRELR